MIKSTTFNWSPQQQTIFDTIHNLVESKARGTITVNAVAGSAKSSSMVEAISRVKASFPTTTIRYLAFNRALVDEARRDYGTNALCSNLHQLAYHNIMRGSSMHLLKNSSYLTYMNIPKSIPTPYGTVPDALFLVSEYCKSPIVSLDDFIDDITSTWEPEEQPSKKVLTLVDDILHAMSDGTMPCTHDFYLKQFYNAVIYDEIELPYCDILILDESQDTTQITIEIVKKFPARLKILVGDNSQAIYSFMGCVNAFSYFPDSTKLSLSQSFRCSPEIAARVQLFGRKYIDPTFTFKGTVTPPSPKPTTMYLTRTNAALVSHMIELEQAGKPFGFSTKTKINQLFEYPLALLRIKPGNDEKNPKFKHMQHLVDKWAKSPTIQAQYTTKLKFLSNVFHDNQEVQAAVKLIIKFGPEDIIKCHSHAKQYANGTANYNLSTAFVSKGLTTDNVVISDDLNKSLSPIINKFDGNPKYKPSPEEQTLIFLYYVAVTRARHGILNAQFLPLVTKE